MTTQTRRNLINLFLLCLFTLTSPINASPHQPLLPAEPDQAVITAKMASLQIPFITNQGQMDEEVCFYARTFGGTVFVTDEGRIVYALPNADGEAPIAGVALYEDLIEGTIQAVIAEDPSITRVNYFIGNDPSQWQQGVPTYNQISLGEVYPGIDLTLKAYGNNVEKLFTVHPGAQPDAIRIQIRGAEGLSVSADGALDVETALGTVRFTPPVAYQETAGQQHTVEVAYHVVRDTYGFTVGEYDPTAALVIDPLLASTFLGGSGEDYGYALALDSSGNTVIAGHTKSANFPTTSGTYDTTLAGDQDVFISKLSSNLSTLIASTFLGGSKNIVGGSGNDYGYSLALDDSGNVVVTGYTSSTDFPTTSGTYDTTLGGAQDAFISKLTSDLSTLAASTFLGGSSGDYGHSLALDGSGNVVVTGYTSSTDFPVPAGAYDMTHNGWEDVFVAKLNNSLTSLASSTYLGGGSGEIGYALALDSSGNVFVGGYTCSNDFPTTSGAYDTTFNGGTEDAFISKLNPNLSTLMASTYLGGSGREGGNNTTAFVFRPALVLDSSGNVFITGDTPSSDFPTTSGAYDRTLTGNMDVFISKLNSNLSTLSASTYLGGGSDEIGRALALDGNGNVVVTGNTPSSDFPTTSNAYDGSNNGAEDVFVSVLSGDLKALSYSTFVGGYNDEYGWSIALDGSGNMVVAGYTTSSNFPTKTPYQSTFGGNLDAFVTKIDLGGVLNSYLLWTR